MATLVPPSEYFGYAGRRLQNFSDCMSCADGVGGGVEVSCNVP